MKQIVLLFGIILMLFNLGIAQVEDSFQQEYSITGGAFLKVDSLSSEQVSLWPEIYATYESSMSEHLTGFFRMNVIIPASVNIKLDKEYDDGIASHSARGFGITLGGRYYINESFRGVYAGPTVSYYRYNHTYKMDGYLNEEEFAITSIRGSFAIGYQYIYEGGFSFNVYLAAMLDHKYFEKFVTPVKTVALGSGNFIKPDLGISLGYHF